MLKGLMINGANSNDDLEKQPLDQMSGHQHLVHFINKISSDDRLKPIHLSICIALCHEWMKCQFQSSYSISRRLLMKTSRIRSKATYHKVIKELQQFGYLKYTPSYHPINASEVAILINDAV